TEIPVDIVDTKAGYLGQAGPCIDQHREQGLVTAVLETRPLTRPQQGPDIGWGDDRHFLLFDLGWAHPIERIDRDVAFFEQPPEKLLERTVFLVGRRVRPPPQQP